MPVDERNDALPVILRVARAYARLDQHDIAERLDVSPATVSHWEGGRSAPHPLARDGVVAALIDLTGLDAEFFEWLEKKVKEQR